MKKDEAVDFSPMIMPMRLLLTPFLAFSRDKIRWPEYFCWPGVWMAGSSIDSDGEDILNRNRALFINKEEDDGITFAHSVITFNDREFGPFAEANVCTLRCMGCEKHESAGTGAFAARKGDFSGTEALANQLWTICAPSS